MPPLLLWFKSFVSITSHLSSRNSDASIGIIRYHILKKTENSARQQGVTRSAFGNSVTSSRYNEL